MSTNAEQAQPDDDDELYEQRDPYYVITITYGPSVLRHEVKLRLYRLTEGTFWYLVRLKFESTRYESKGQLTRCNLQ